MFSIDIVENRQALNALLTTNTEFVFLPGIISSLHKHNMCLTQFDFNPVDVEEAIVSDMEQLKTVMNRKTVVKAKLAPEAGKIVVTTPFKWYPAIPRLKNEKYVSEVQKQIRRAEILSKSNNIFRDDFGKKHKVSTFEYDNMILSDAIRCLGPTENLEIRTGESLKITNLTTGERVVLSVSSEPKVKINLSRDGKDLLLEALSVSEESHFTIANRVLLLVENTILMNIAGRLPE